MTTRPQMVYPRTKDEVLDWLGMTPALFDLMLECDVFTLPKAEWSYPPYADRLDRLGNVYFVKFTRPTYLIKIGYTVRADGHRMNELARERLERPEPLHVIRGNKHVEASLHEKFAHLHHEGEYFYNVPELMGYVLELGGQS